MNKKNTPTFGKDGKRRLRCRKCDAFFASKNGGVSCSYIGEKATRKLKCKKCGYEGFYSPPKIEVNEKGQNIIYWNLDESGKNGMTTLEGEPSS